MINRDEIKQNLYELIDDLKLLTDKCQELANQLDDLNDEQLFKESSKLVDTFNAYGIELY